MTILNDLKNFLTQKNIIPSDDIVYNFDDFIQGHNKLILMCKGGEFSDVARKTTVSVIVKNQSMQMGEEIINSAYDALCPPNQYEKPVLINNKLMLIKAQTPPFYKEKEKNGRHVYMFDIKIVHTR